MTLLPAAYYRKTRGITRVGTRAAQPAANTVLEGTIYFISDELILERSNGTIWQAYSPPVGASAPVEQVTTLTGTQHDFSLTGRNVILRCNNASALTITGFTVNGGAPQAGDRVFIRSGSTGNVFFSYFTGSSAGRKLVNPISSGNIPLAASKGTATYIYHANAAAWVLQQHEQGGYIVDTYNAADYTASTGTWTVDSGDVINVSYYLNGVQLTCNVVVNSTSVSASPASLRRAVPGGYFATSNAPLLFFLGNPGGVFGLCQIQISGNLLLFYSSISTAGTWSPSTNSTSVGGTFFFEIG